MDCLPLELRQMILSYLDPFSFQSAILSGKAWKEASQDAAVLRRHISRLPLTPMSRQELYEHGLKSLQTAQQRAVADLLLGVHISKLPASMPASGWANTWAATAKIAYSTNRSRVAVLEDRLLSLYSRCLDEDNFQNWQLINRRRLNDADSPIRNGPVLVDAPSSAFHLAIADTSDMVAVALDRSVQLYDMQNGDEPPIAAYINAAWGQSIAGLDFDCQDAALRLRLKKKGAVLYLGEGAIGEVNFAHWKVQFGLHKVFLNSLSIRIPGADEEHTINPAGLQLLDRQHGGWNFVAQELTTSWMNRLDVGWNYIEHESISGYFLGWISDEAVWSSTTAPQGVEAKQALVDAPQDVVVCAKRHWRSCSYWRTRCGKSPPRPEGDRGNAGETASHARLCVPVSKAQENRLFGQEQRRQVSKARQTSQAQRARLRAESEGQVIHNCETDDLGRSVHAIRHSQSAVRGCHFGRSHIALRTRAASICDSKWCRRVTRIARRSCDVPGPTRRSGPADWYFALRPADRPGSGWAGTSDSVCICICSCICIHIRICNRIRGPH
ncbi:hypothetical protein ANO11243_000990 [Dothideomycetidae sp. 11243]|nr:hypothetical protein ANO11243_000990 [fungal sp. No.11243]